MIKLAVFDLDDTIFLTEEAVFYMENEIAVEMGFTPMSRETHKRNWGKKLREAISERIPGINPDDFLARIPEKLRQHVDAGKVDFVREEVLVALDTLKNNNMQIAILTARSRAEIEHLTDPTHLITSRITKLYYLDNSPFHKPDPRVFDLILKEQGVRADETVYVGDALSDGISSKGAGVKFIAYLEGGVRTSDDYEPPTALRPGFQLCKP